jgi:Pyrimidine dimer DNA glycosylase
MRLWSLHPRYLDGKGLVAVWREGLLAQAVLAGKTRGYRSHPQLVRFRQTITPRTHIATYLHGVRDEAMVRGYRFNSRKIGRGARAGRLQVTEGQLAYEWAHLKSKLRKRDPAWLDQFGGLTMPDPHPLFRCIPGDVAAWEVVEIRQR